MDALRQFIAHIYNFQELIRTGGYVALTLIVFAETGLLAGFFLPGDSLLVTAGLVCALENSLNIWILNGLLAAAAILGDTAGYWIGYHIGPKLFTKEDSLIFKKSHILKTQAFYEKHGAKTIVLARFVPIIRTFAPTVAGVGRMDYKKFLSFNVLGGTGWVLGMTSIGYFLGRTIPNIDKKIHHVVLIVIFLSFLPLIKEWWASRQEKSVV